MWLALCVAGLLLAVAGMARLVVRNKLVPQSVKAISLDVTGTLLVHRLPIHQAYYNAFNEVNIADKPELADLKVAFKKAFKETSTKYPCFGSGIMSDRDWWYLLVQEAIKFTGKTYDEATMQRYFRSVYQHYGSLEGYEVLQDAKEFLEKYSSRYLLGITSNTPVRTMENCLPSLGLSKYFKFFVCSQDVGYEKPSPNIYKKSIDEVFFFAHPLIPIRTQHSLTHSLTKIKYYNPSIQPHEILHIGDNLISDYCGSVASNMQSLFLDRSGNSKVIQFSDYDASAYVIDETALRQSTVRNFQEIDQLLKL